MTYATVLVHNSLHDMIPSSDSNNVDVLTQARPGSQIQAWSLIQLIAHCEPKMVGVHLTS